MRTPTKKEEFIELAKFRRVNQTTVGMQNFQFKSNFEYKNMRTPIKMLKHIKLQTIDMVIEVEVIPSQFLDSNLKHIDKQERFLKAMDKINQRIDINNWTFPINLRSKFETVHKPITLTDINGKSKTMFYSSWTNNYYKFSHKQPLAYEKFIEDSKRNRQDIDSFDFTGAKEQWVDGNTPLKVLRFVKNEWIQSTIIPATFKIGSLYYHKTKQLKKDLS